VFSIQCTNLLSCDYENGRFLTETPFYNAWELTESGSDPRGRTRRAPLIFGKEFFLNIDHLSYYFICSRQMIRQKQLHNNTAQHVLVSNVFQGNVSVHKAHILPLLS